VAKILVVVHLAVNGRGTIELTVVESIECFRSKLQRSRFGQVHILLKRHIEVIDSWPIKDAALGVAELTDRFLRKQRRIERRAPIASIGVYLQRSWQMLRSIEQIVICAVAQGTKQRVVRTIVERCGKSGSEARSSGEGPLCGQTV
jgi:hypothetical protein